MKIEEGHVKVDNRMCLFHSREKVRRGGKGGGRREGEGEGRGEKRGRGGGEKEWRGGKGGRGTPETRSKGPFGIEMLICPSVCLSVTSNLSFNLCYVFYFSNS